MKYMGSKAAMLKVGLGSLLLREVTNRDRFVDLFSGSAVVASTLAVSYPTEVVAVDTQAYSGVLAGAVLERTDPISIDVVSEWLERAKLRRIRHGVRSYAAGEPLTRSAALNERELASSLGSSGWVTRAYAGHYFSLQQTLEIDSLIESIEDAPKESKIVLLAAVLEACSSAAAAPGHTAQPFQPSERLLPHISSAWSRSVSTLAEKSAIRIASIHAQRTGLAVVDDAQHFAEEFVRSSDLVFCDPPYSEVQYSRFYHVLEGIARGGWEELQGAGRAPALRDRFTSDFSSRRNSSRAFRDLFRALADAGSTVVLTFPNHACSNGQSAASLEAFAAEFFAVERLTISVPHSSLGGARATDSKSSRSARRNVEEMVLTLRPRR
jgi:adenine-specific DNA-methyltransferase